MKTQWYYAVFIVLIFIIIKLINNIKLINRIALKCYTRLQKYIIIDK